MRTTDQIRERIQLSIIEVINNTSLQSMYAEPENAVPAFVEKLTNAVTEITLDEITFRRR